MPIDYSKYPPNWKTEIVPAVLARAGEITVFEDNEVAIQACCESCGLENKSTVYAIKMDVRENGSYKLRSIWFRSEQDAVRECLDWREVKPVKVVLTVAHLDHDEENHEVTLDRLAALCQLCHLRYDAKEKHRRILNKPIPHR